jgi:hypothetical protein
MKTIARHFATLAQAERFQNALYGQWNYVRLVRSPLFSESGVYSWEVK